MSQVPDRGAARCVGEPVSWMRLERFHLGEIDGTERAPIADHLAACEACAACLARIREDEAVALPVLPALPSRLPAKQRRRGGMVASLAALAAAVTLVLGLHGGVRPGADRDEQLAGTGEGAIGARVKGGAIAFMLVREDGERIEGPEGIYRDGDRFKAVVTCPPGGHVGFDVAVNEGGRSSYPLPQPVGFGCGNEVPIPGAFRLTGGAVETVCLEWDEDGAVARDGLAEKQPALCKRLSPAQR
jgi:hypothetical protein